MAINIKIGDVVTIHFKGRDVKIKVTKINPKSVRGKGHCDNSIALGIHTVRVAKGRILKAEADKPSDNINKTNAVNTITTTSTQVRANSSSRTFSPSQTSDYEKSNAEKIQPISDHIVIKSLHATVKRLSLSLLEGNEDDIRIGSNAFVSILCSHYGVRQVVVYTGGKRIVNRGRQTYGVHRTRHLGSVDQCSSISVFSRTAKTQKFVAPKTFLKTLIHEWIHHWDRYYLGIIHEYHTTGFYGRLKQLYDQLKVCLE